MVDTISSHTNSLLRAQAAGSVTPKVTTPTQAVINQVQKTATSPVKSSAVPQTTKTAGSSSGNLPRGSLVDIRA